MLAVSVLFEVVAKFVAGFFFNISVAWCIDLMGESVCSSICPSQSRASVLVAEVYFSGGFLRPFAEYSVLIILVATALSVPLINVLFFRDERNLCLHSNDVFLLMPANVAAFRTESPRARASRYLGVFCFLWSP